jgi:hypothetical protein
LRLLKRKWPNGIIETPLENISMSVAAFLSMKMTYAASKDLERLVLFFLCIWAVNNLFLMVCLIPLPPGSPERSICGETCLCFQKQLVNIISLFTICGRQKE